MENLINDIGISIIVATLIGILTHRLNQPVILGYLIAGAIIGPEFGLKIIKDQKSIEVISGIGLILLLFIIGLEIDIRGIIRAGKQLLVAGIGQFFLCVALGLGFFHILGFTIFGVNSDGIYLALLCALSSTTIVVKLLYDKNEFDTLAGRITIGVIIIQDIWAILIISFQPSFVSPQFIIIIKSVLKSFALLGAGFLFSKYILKHLFVWITKSPEMVVATSIGWCAALSGAAAYIGLSKEMGALIAGVSISNFPYSIHVTAKTLPLRDFFLTLFFISLGMKITYPESAIVYNSLIVVGFLIVSRFLSVYPLLSLSGSGRRTCFITSLNLSQLSEFSLVIASLGVAYKHISKDTLIILTYTMAITSALSSYFIKYNHQIYKAVDFILNRIGLKTKFEKEEERTKTFSYPIIILGFSRIARLLVEKISNQNKSLLNKILVIDFNTEFFSDLRAKNISCLFGDVSSTDTLKRARVEDAKIILSTIPDTLLRGTNNVNLVMTCRVLSPNSTIIAAAYHPEQVDKLKEAGATEVIFPYSMAGEYLTNILSSKMNELPSS